MSGRIIWATALVLLSVLVSAREGINCGECSCKELNRPPDKITEMNCTGIGNDLSSVGRQVLIPHVDYNDFETPYVWAYFRRNNITKVQILNLDFVSKLYLDENDIDVIYDNAFSNVGRSLTELSLTHNKLRQVRSRVFESLKKLKVLDLSYNKLTELNFDDFSLKEALKTLILTSNHISKIKNSGMKDLSSLETLDLSSNQLMSITDENFMKLNNLTTLNLSNNKLASLPWTAFASLKALKTLDLSYNSLSTFLVQPLLSLKQLRIGYNSVTDLETLMKNFPNIQELHIQSSGIQTLNKNAKFDALSVFNLSGNELSDFPTRDFPVLLDLDLSNNKLRAVPPVLNGKNLPSLRSLNLDGNPLGTVHFSTKGAPFKKLHQLSLCHLDVLQRLDEQAFPTLIEPSPGYQGLNLSVAHNKHLADLQNEALKQAQPLYMLDLSYNALTSLPMNLVPWESIPTVNLQGNPWNCQCSLQWMLDEVVGHIFRKGDRRLLGDLRCASPARFRERRLVHYYNWTPPALCSEDQMLGRMRTTDRVEVNLFSGSSEGMLIAVSVLGALFLVLVIAGVSLHLKNKNHQRKRNRRF